MKWEHKKVFDPNKYQLLELGEEGWELVAVDKRLLTGTSYLFKRSLQEEIQ